MVALGFHLFATFLCGNAIVSLLFDRARATALATVAISCSMIAIFLKLGA